MTDKPQDQQEPVEPQPNDNDAVEPDTDAMDVELSPHDALQAERDELFSRLQRVSADYQNYMRRSAQNLNDSVELARGDMVKPFITVLDHFDNALSQEPQTDEAKALYEGVRIVRDEMMRVLTNMEVERIEPAVGDTFNPDVHEAMLRQPAEGVAADHVTAVFQPGYRYKQRTLRPAKVAVAPEGE